MMMYNCDSTEEINNSTAAQVDDDGIAAQMMMIVVVEGMTVVGPVVSNLLIGRPWTQC